MSKKRMFVMCGIPGSGKSTWIHNHKGPTDSVVSRDVIRYSMLKDGDTYFSKENEVYAEFIKEIKEALKTSNITFVDATHLNQASRTKLLRALGSALKGIEINAMVLKTPLEVAIQQNNKREGRARVPEDVIKNMYKDYTTPTIEEGFDSIWQAVPNKNKYEYTYSIEYKDICEYYAESED